jgi:hypothetical protein
MIIDINVDIEHRSKAVQNILRQVGRISAQLGIGDTRSIPTRISIYIDDSQYRCMQILITVDINVNTEYAPIWGIYRSKLIHREGTAIVPGQFDNRSKSRAAASLINPHHTSP